MPQSKQQNKNLRCPDFLAMFSFRRLISSALMPVSASIPAFETTPADIAVRFAIAQKHKSQNSRIIEFDEKMPFRHWHGLT